MQATQSSLAHALPAGKIAQPGSAIASLHAQAGAGSFKEAPGIAAGVPGSFEELRREVAVLTIQSKWRAHKQTSSADKQLPAAAAAAVTQPAQQSQSPTAAVSAHVADQQVADKLPPARQKVSRNIAALPVAAASKTGGESAAIVHALCIQTCTQSCTPCMLALVVAMLLLKQAYACDWSSFLHNWRPLPNAWLCTCH